MDKFSAFVIKARWFIIVFVIAVSVLLGFQIPKIKINSDIINSLPAHDKDAVLMRQIGEQFGGNRLGMVILDCENVFNPEVLKHVKQITDSLTQIQGITSVTSLTNAIDVKSTDEGMEIGRLVDEFNIPETQEELAKLKENVLSNNRYTGTLVSADGTAAIVIFSLSEDADIQKMARIVEEKINSLQLPERIYYAGSPMLVTSIANLISADLKLLFPIALLVIALVLFLSFHSWRGVIFPLLVCIIAIDWVIGTMGLFGFEMSMVSNNIPIVLLAVGSAYAIHVLHWIGHVKAENQRKAIAVAIASVAIPVILAALTTMAGFLSFIFGSYLKMIRDFGLFTALGTFFSLFLSLIFVPALLSVFSSNKKSAVVTHEPVIQKSLLHTYFLSPLQRFLYSYPKQIIWAWLILAVVAIFGITLIQRNVDVRNYFKKENPTRIAEDIMTRKFGGTKPVFVLFTGDILSPELLNTMARMEEYMKKSPDIAGTQSVAGLIADINGAFGDSRKIPDEKEMVEQLWFLLDGNENVQKLVNPELTEAIIISKFVSSENKLKKEFAEYMQKFIAENENEAFTIQVTGMPFIESSLDQSLINSQIGSLIIAVIFVIFIVGLILRSLLSGIYAAVPIIASIAVLFGFMGYSGIPLNIATVLVASIAVGIGIDYSIHVITHFNNALKKGEDIHQALDETIGISGKAIIINVFSVSAGFLVLLFSEMVPLEYFGMLISLSMFSSGLGALTLLPAILIVSHKKKV
jgi:predicted RND superfamily exporter protein